MPLIERPEALTTFELIEILSTLITNPKHHEAIMLWGLTGTGKSQIQRQILAKIAGKNKWEPKDGMRQSSALEVIGDWGLVDLRTSLLEPTDLLGLPDLRGQTVRWVAPEELPLIGQENRFPEKGVLLLDELNHAQPAMQSACYSLVLDRRCGPHMLLPGWKIVAASNYVSENAYTYPLSGPLRVRFKHFHLRCSLEAFKEWGYAHDIDLRIIAFLNWNPAYLHKPSENTEETFPTPRSWANASLSLESFETRHREKVLSSDLGPGAAGVFNGFLETFNFTMVDFDIPGVLTKKQKAPVLNMEAPHNAWAFASGVAGHVKDNPKLLDAAIAFFTSDAWKRALEIGRTGLADLKYVVGKDTYVNAIEPHLGTITKRFGKLM